MSLSRIPVRRRRRRRRTRVPGQLGVRERQGHQTQDRTRIQMRSIRYEGQEDRRREAIGDVDMICFWVACMAACV
jgi:hypothetical protein